MFFLRPKNDYFEMGINNKINYSIRSLHNIRKGGIIAQLSLYHRNIHGKNICILASYRGNTTTMTISPAGKPLIFINPELAKT
jgi:hypothetical protein